MKNSGFDLKKLLATSLALLAVNLAGVTGLMSGGAALAIDADDDTGVFGSVGVARMARTASKAMANKDWPTAVQTYKQAISQKNDFPGFYYGLLYSALQVQDFASAAIALEGISDKDAEGKTRLNFEFGHVYSNVGRWDEAIPLLKVAVGKSNADASFLFTKVHELQQDTEKRAPKLKAGDIDPATGKVIEEYKEPEKFVVPTRDLVKGDTLNIDTNKIGDDYESAYRKCEWIGICEYKGYEKKPDLGFYNPPTANFNRIECLMGPPLATRLPVHFKFYEIAQEKPPAGWKFGDDKMPAIGSKWIIFIQNAVPTAGAFDTYKGVYGRQPATEENVGEIRRILEAHKGQI
jgi:tetratricopeptide (TPR) repeat protein